jgi:hypothetical protein
MKNIFDKIELAGISIYHYKEDGKTLWIRIKHLHRGWS